MLKIEATEFEKNLDEYFSKVLNENETLLISVGAERHVVVISRKEYDTLLEAVENAEDLQVVLEYQEEKKVGNEEIILKMLADIQADLGGIKTDLGGIKTDLGGIKTDLGSIQAGIGEIKQVQQCHTEKLNKLLEFTAMLTASQIGS